MGRKELETELRELRLSSGAKPVSKMKMLDIASEIQRLKVRTAETPFPASVSSAPVKMSKSAVESIKEAKAEEFPVKPESSKKNLKPKGEKPVRPAQPKVIKSKGKSKMERIADMLNEDSE